MGEFHYYLQYEHPALVEFDPDKESVLDGVKSAICTNVDMFLEINEDEFAKFLQAFATDAWSLLVKVSLKPGQVRAGALLSSTLYSARSVQNEHPFFKM